MDRGPAGRRGIADFSVLTVLVFPSPEMQALDSVMNTLPDIDDVAPLSADDEACLTEVRRVLEEHGALQRFGVALLHQHFAVQDDEILVEECDVASRTLKIRPQKRTSPATSRSIQTVWRLDTPTPVQGCMQVCTKDENNNHIRKSHL